MSEYVRTVPWYDRNAQCKIDRYYLLHDPHDPTERLSYTVPKGRQAMLELLQSYVVRDSAADPVGQANIAWYLTPKAGEEKCLDIVLIITNNVGDSDKSTLPTAITMFEDDKLRCLTVDASTGGQCIFNLSYKLTEFDAFPIEELPFKPELPPIDIQEPKKPFWWPF